MHSPTPELSQFAEDVLRGLSATPKQLSSKYFYDDEGSRLFQEIMQLPEYYLTRAEYGIFIERANDIREAFTREAKAIDLVELGAGDGTKTAVLIDHFLKRNVNFSYSPIDISQEANDALLAKFTEKFPGLRIRPHTGDYFKVLGSLKDGSGRRKIVMFLGSNIGNFQREQAVDFFRQLRSVLNPNDRLFVGFDMQKDPRKIVSAYDDPEGVTAAFNLNLLRRINREAAELFPKIDYFLIGIGAYEPRWFMEPNHNNPSDAVRAFIDSGARYLVPMHYGTFDLSDEPPSQPLRFLMEEAGKQGIASRVRPLTINEALLVAQ